MTAGGPKPASTTDRLRSVERLARTVRHSRALARLDPLWDTLRPGYNRALHLLGKGTVTRLMNGQTPLRLLVQHREISDEWEPEVWHHLIGGLRPGDVFVDVGAHIGLYAVAAAQQIGTTGRVHAFEPDPATVQSLIAHARVNDVESVVDVHAVAVGAEPGSVAFHAHGHAESAVATTMVENATSVAMTTLDEALDGVAISVLKIDVEGYEAHVLRGATKILADPARAPRSIYVELHPYAWDAHGVTFDEIRELLESHGYRVTGLDGLPVTTVESWSEIVAQRVAP